MDDEIVDLKAKREAKKAREVKSATPPILNPDLDFRLKMAKIAGDLATANLALSQMITLVCQRVEVLENVVLQMLKDR